MHRCGAGLTNRQTLRSTQALQARLQLILMVHQRVATAICVMFVTACRGCTVHVKRPVRHIIKHEPVPSDIKPTLHPPQRGVGAKELHVSAAIGLSTSAVGDTALLQSVMWEACCKAMLACSSLSTAVSEPECWDTPGPIFATVICSWIHHCMSFCS